MRPHIVVVRSNANFLLNCATQHLSSQAVWSDVATSNNRILVVDDDITSSTIIKFPLEESGYATEVAADPQSALDLCERNNFDLIISDVGLPQMTGTELITRLRKDTRYTATPVILITSKSYEDEIQQSRERLQIAAVFDKPFSPKKLLRTVESLLSSENVKPPADTA